MRQTCRPGALCWLALAGCHVSADANPAPRCASKRDCEVDQICSHGFCVPAPDDDTAHELDAAVTEVDAGKSPVPDAGRHPSADAGVRAPTESTLPQPAVPTPTQPVAPEPSVPIPTEPSAPEPSVPTTPEPPANPDASLPCDAGLSSCRDKCVDLLEDNKHCGACGHKCDRGPCHGGICEREDDDDH
ncbi:MAG: hypothetical protein QM778_17135 [Myxococcales bacterium]